MKTPFRTVEADWFDADWMESSSGYEKTIDIDVFGNREQFAANMEHLYSIIAVDAEEGTYGRLYAGFCNTSLQYLIYARQCRSADLRYDEASFVINVESATVKRAFTQ